MNRLLLILLFIVTVLYLIFLWSDEEVPVLAITHWTEELFSFSLRRPKSFRFSAGEFVMLGLTTEEGQQILRAYSIASPTWSDALLFYSINIKDGSLTSRLSKIKPSDGVILKRKAKIIKAFSGKRI